jgi:fatty acid desaturase
MQSLNKTLRKQLRELYGEKSNIKASWAILINWTALIICFFLIGVVISHPFSWLTILIYLLLSFFAGCCLRGFDNLTHEASHNNIFTNEELHLSLQFLYAFPVGKTVQDYRPGHRKHHRNYRINKDDDPDTQQNIRWGVEFLPPRLTFSQISWFYVARFFLCYYVVDNIRYNLIGHIRSKEALLGRILCWLVILMIVFLTNGWTLFLFAYLLPYFIWLPYIRFVTESSKHTNVNLQDDFANSRSNIGLIHQLLLHPHNDGFHQMHHYMSSIPFYNLKKAYRFMKADPAVRSKLIESYSPWQTVFQIFKTKQK